MITQRPYQFFPSIPLIGALALCSFLVGLTGEAAAKEFTFIAEELGKEKGVFEMGETEIWLPHTVLIDQQENLKEPIWFVIENPTGVDHEFAVWGLFMFLSEEETMLDMKMDPRTRRALAEAMPVPIYVKVKAGATKKIQVAPIGIAGVRNLGARYPFFCPKHKDIRISGFIFVD